MKREYTVEEFRTVVEVLTEKVPGMTLATVRTVLLFSPGARILSFVPRILFVDFQPRLRKILKKPLEYVYLQLSVVEKLTRAFQVIGDYKLAIVNISQFYPRPGTPAAKMKQLSGSIKKDRSRRLTKLFYSFDPYRDLLGKEFLVGWNTACSSFAPVTASCPLSRCGLTQNTRMMESTSWATQRTMSRFGTSVASPL